MNRRLPASLLGCGSSGVTSRCALTTSPSHVVAGSRAARDRDRQDQGEGEGETYAHRQELEPTADSLTSALLLNQHVHSVEKAKRILRVRATLDPYQDTQAIKAVDEVIHATKVRHLISRG